MTRDELERWLDARHPAPPPSLDRRLRAAAHDAALPLAPHLARLGLDLLAGIVARPDGGRELAVDLLAADAFVTYAFEAQADLDVDGLVVLAEYVAREGGA